VEVLGSVALRAAIKAKVLAAAAYCSGEKPGAFEFDRVTIVAHDPKVA
jgi:hypothetical protein